MLGVGELNANNVSRKASGSSAWGYADPVIATIRRVIQNAAAPTGPNFRPKGGYGAECCIRIDRNLGFLIRRMSVSLPLV